MRAAGFGFRGAATAESLSSAFDAAGGGPVDCVAAPEDKAATALFAGFAGSVGAKRVGVTAEALQQMTTRSQSPASQAYRGVGSVAEAAALAAAGPGARLIGPRAVSADRLATCAIAEGEGA